jgi:UDP-N-acetylmuramate--alanine ligase
VLTYAEAVGLLTREFSTIAVCGSHGKTTTTNLLGHVVGGLVIAGPTSPEVIEKLSPAKTLVLEADEYENKLKYFSPHGVILTNIDWDHPDFFKTKKQYEKVFIDFVKKIPEDGFLVYCEDDETCRRVAGKAVCKHIPYSVRTVNHKTLGTPFALQSDGKNVGVFRTSLMGQHNPES